MKVYLFFVKVLVLSMCVLAGTPNASYAKLSFSQVAKLKLWARSARSRLHHSMESATTGSGAGSTTELAPDSTSDTAPDTAPDSASSAVMEERLLTEATNVAIRGILKTEHAGVTASVECHPKRIQAFYFHSGDPSEETEFLAYGHGADEDDQEYQEELDRKGYTNNHFASNDKLEKRIEARVFTNKQLLLEDKLELFETNLFYVLKNEGAITDRDIEIAKLTPETSLIDVIINKAAESLNEETLLSIIAEANIESLNFVLKKNSDGKLSLVLTFSPMLERKSSRSGVDLPKQIVAKQVVPGSEISAYSRVLKSILSLLPFTEEPTVELVTQPATKPVIHVDPTYAQSVSHQKALQLQRELHLLDWVIADLDRLSHSLLAKESPEGAIGEVIRYYYDNIYIFSDHDLAVLFTEEYNRVIKFMNKSSVRGRRTKSEERSGWTPFMGSGPRGSSYSTPLSLYK